MKINHIGYLVKNLDKSLNAFLKLGYKIKQKTILDEYRQIKICFIEKNGYVIELVTPISKTSVVSKLIKKIGNSAYHICYETDDILSEMKNLENSGYILCSELHQAIAFQNRRVCFYLNPYLGIIELLEK